MKIKNKIIILFVFITSCTQPYQGGSIKSDSFALIDVDEWTRETIDALEKGCNVNLDTVEKEYYPIYTDTDTVISMKWHLFEILETNRKTLLKAVIDSGLKLNAPNIRITETYASDGTVWYIMQKDTLTHYYIRFFTMKTELYEMSILKENYYQNYFFKKHYPYFYIRDCFFCQQINITSIISISEDKKVSYIIKEVMM